MRSIKVQYRQLAIAACLFTACSAKESSTIPTSTRALSWAEIIEASPDSEIVVSDTLLAQIRVSGLPWRVRDSISKIEMLLAPPGTYIRGNKNQAPSPHDWSYPPHGVAISKPFYLGRFEVMGTEWDRIATGSMPAYDYRLPKADISYVDIKNWLVKNPGLRLPTEAEWEYACRAAGTTPLIFDHELDQVAWYKKNSLDFSQPVGKKISNALGFYDMLGNVCEMCSDWYRPDEYEACKGGVKDPMGPQTGVYRVIRGGAWALRQEECREYVRSGNRPDTREMFVGFRVARDP